MRPEKRVGKDMILQLFNEMQTVRGMGLKKKNQICGSQCSCQTRQWKICSPERITECSLFLIYLLLKLKEITRQL